jgi:hypothetical protein
MIPLLAMTLDAILYNTLHREIGLKLVIAAGASHFGMRTILVPFKEQGKIYLLTI